MNDDRNLPAAATTQEVATQTVDPMAIWASIERMAENPNIDAAKIGALMDHQIRLMEYSAKNAFVAARNAAMQEMPIINKSSQIVHNGKLVGRYTKYEDLRRIIDPILARHGLRVTHRPGFSEAMKMPTCEAILHYAQNGQTHVEECGAMLVPFDTSGAKNATQGAGSSLQYGMRYATCGALGIVQEGIDNDGNGAPKEQDAKWQEAIVDDARRAATQGFAAYSKWYSSQSGMKRGYLLDCGEHDKLKAASKEHGE